jgi:hypothetical protein
MKIEEALIELVIFAREQDAQERPELSRALHCIEQLNTRMRVRRQRRLKNQCVRCEQRRTDGMLCWTCMADAPPEVQRAFEFAVGLDGMRAAVKTVMDWARPNEKGERAA